jgi:hypothetical protein
MYVHLCCALAAGFSLIPRTAIAQESAAEGQWISLFNGSDLDHWTIKIRHRPVGENFADTFRVQDGVISVSYDGYDRFDGQFGHIYYKQPFSHYRLRLEYRFVGEAAPNAPEWAIRNSGVMFHSQAPETVSLDQDFPISLEFQFLGGMNDGNPRPTGNLCTPGTHVVYAGELTTTHCIHSASPTFHGDQWVKAEVLVLGDGKIVHYINGEPVIEYEKPTYGGEAATGHRPDAMPEGEPLRGGYIALQSEGHPVQFRRIELLNLEGRQ